MWFFFIIIIMEKNWDHDPYSNNHHHSINFFLIIYLKLNFVFPITYFNNDKNKKQNDKCICFFNVFIHSFCSHHSSLIIQLVFVWLYLFFCPWSVLHCDFFSKRKERIVIITDHHYIVMTIVDFCCCWCCPLLFFRCIILWKFFI